MFREELVKAMEGKTKVNLAVQAGPFYPVKSRRNVQIVEIDDVFVTYKNNDGSRKFVSLKGICSVEEA